MTKIITAQQIEENYDIKEITKRVEEAYKLLNQGKIVVPPRHFVTTKDGGDYFYGSAVNLEREAHIAMCSPFMPWNAELNKQIVNQYYLYQSFRTGELLAVINGVDVVKFRTAAKSVVAAKYLAKKDSKTLGLIGLGNQAMYHAEAFCAKFKIEKIVGFCRNPEKWQKTLTYIKKKTGLDVEVLSREEVINDADVVVVATHSKEPLVNFSELHKGQLIIGLDHAESVSKDLVGNCDKSFVDYYQTAQTELGPVKMLIENGFDIKKLDGDLGEVVTKQKVGRQNDNEIIFFQSLGVLNENLATIEYFYDMLKEKSKEVDLDK